MYARATTSWTILRISIEERLVYRGDFALGTLMRFLPIVTQVFLWGAIFSAVGSSGDFLAIVNLGSNTVTISDTGIMKLSGDAALGQTDTILLVCDGTNGYEVAQTNN